MHLVDPARMVPSERCRGRQASASAASLMSQPRATARRLSSGLRPMTPRGQRRAVSCSRRQHWRPCGASMAPNVARACASTCPASSARARMRQLRAPRRWALGPAPSSGAWRACQLRPARAAIGCTCPQRWQPDAGRPCRRLPTGPGRSRLKLRKNSLAISCRGFPPLSSAEAELSATRTLSEAKGWQPIGEDFDECLKIRAYVDAQATIGSSHRAGLGKARYIKRAEL